MAVTLKSIRILGITGNTRIMGNFTQFLFLQFKSHVKIFYHQSLFGNINLAQNSGPVHTGKTRHDHIDIGVFPAHAKTEKGLDNQPDAATVSDKNIVFPLRAGIAGHRGNFIVFE